ncbi:MAG: DUF488 domain-containing protein [Pseudomonadota bacterium]
MPIYTIGHSNHAFETFAGLLKSAGVTAIADVRSAPYSKHCPQFRKNTLAAASRAAGIAYVYLGDDLGGKPKNAAFYTHGRSDYGKIAATPGFHRAIARLLKGAKTHAIALMCAEADPERCHRTGLIAPALETHGVEVLHLLPNGERRPHETVAGGRSLFDGSAGGGKTL